MPLIDYAILEFTTFVPQEKAIFQLTPPIFNSV